ncbi:MAG: hypothetical protein ICV64_10250 [Thermoleophilia bacterium]|nr:hypothetical protein [Thermoleophilia bacterium]
MRFCDDLGAAGFGWEAQEFLRRTSHALAHDGGVWLLDPVDAPQALARAERLGDVRAVVQLIDRHDRDCAALAARLAVPHLEVPFDGVPGSPFEVVRIADRPFWHEVALWWPERRVLVCGDALGTVGYFLAPGDRLGVHPLLRLTPPRVLATLEPEHVLVGHGAGVHGPDAAAAVERAVATARRRIPGAFLHGFRQLLRHG